MQVVLQRGRENELGRRGKGVEFGFKTGQEHPEDREKDQDGDSPGQGAQQQALQAARLL